MAKCGSLILTGDNTAPFIYLALNGKPDVSESVGLYEYKEENKKLIN